MSAVLERTTFSTPRALDYFSTAELERQTGQPRSRFAAVAVNELVDNALDACEAVGVQPRVRVAAERRGAHLHITVADNGPGLPLAALARILDFGTVTSDKAAYRSPTRGAQGNALKTVLGIPYALAGESATPITVEACGVRHMVHPWVTPAGDVRIPDQEEPVALRPGTRITVTLPSASQEDRAAGLLLGYRLFNPYADVPRLQKARRLRHGTKSTRSAWREWSSDDAGSPHWYSIAALARLIFAPIADARAGGRVLTLRDFVGGFAGLSGKITARQLAAAMLEVRRLSLRGSAWTPITDEVAVTSAQLGDVAGTLVTPSGAPHMGEQRDVCQRRRKHPPRRVSRNRNEVLHAAGTTGDGGVHSHWGWSTRPTF